MPNLINSCTGNKTTIISLAKMIVKLTNSKSNINYSSLRKWDKVQNRLGSNVKIKKIFGINKFTNLSTGLKETIKWYKNK